MSHEFRMVSCIEEALWAQNMPFRVSEMTFEGFLASISLVATVTAKPMNMISAHAVTNLLVLDQGGLTELSHRRP